MDPYRSAAGRHPHEGARGTAACGASRCDHDTMLRREHIEKYHGLRKKHARKRKEGSAVTRACRNNEKSAKNSNATAIRTTCNIKNMVRTHSEAFIDLKFGFRVCLLLTPNVGGRIRATSSCTHGIVESSTKRTSRIITYIISPCSQVRSDVGFELAVQQNPLPAGASGFRRAGAVDRVFLGHLCTDRPENAGFGVASARAAAAPRAAAPHWARVPLGSALHTRWHGHSSSTESAAAVAIGALHSLGATTAHFRRVRCVCAVCCAAVPGAGRAAPAAECSQRWPAAGSCAGLGCGDGGKHAHRASSSRWRSSSVRVVRVACSRVYGVWSALHAPRKPM